MLAGVVAAVHAALVLFVVVGGLLALRRPRLRLVHLVALAAVAAINLAGADCPLTTLEQALREAGGASPHRAGFLDHYLLSRLGVDPGSTGSQLGQRALVVVPNVVAYGLLIARSAPRGAVAGRA